MVILQNGLYLRPDRIELNCFLTNISSLLDNVCLISVVSTPCPLKGVSILGQQYNLVTTKQKSLLGDLGVRHAFKEIY